MRLLDNFVFIFDPANLYFLQTRDQDLFNAVLDASQLQPQALNRLIQHLLMFGFSHISRNLLDFVQLYKQDFVS